MRRANTPGGPDGLDGTIKASQLHSCTVDRPTLPEAATQLDGSVQVVQAENVKPWVSCIEGI